MKNLALFISLIILLTPKVNYAQDNSQVYVIGHHSSEGLFSCFFGVLNALLKCEGEKKNPVVYWSKNSYYYQEGGFNGSTNVWEYYFEPVSAYRYEPGCTIDNRPSSQPYFFTRCDQETRNKAHRMISTYIRFKPQVQKKVDDFYQQNMAGKRNIGIHLRGTDRGNFKTRQSNEFPLVQDMALKALECADENTQFYIATDEQSLFDAILPYLVNHTVIYYPCYRSMNGKPLHRDNHQDGFNAPSKAQLGEDVLVEALLLSKCDVLLHSTSSVSTGVLYFNPNIVNYDFARRHTPIPNQNNRLNRNRLP